VSPRRQALWLLAAGVLLRGLLAGRWGVTADEALLWAEGAGGQAPAQGWLLAHVPPHPLALRLPGLLMQALGAVALLAHVSHPRRFVSLVVVTPALWGLGGFATPAGWASGLWALALAASLRGGAGHLVAGALVALGTGLGADVASTLLAWPALVLAAMDPDERRQPWGWAGAGLAAVVAVAVGVRGPGWTDVGSPLQVVVHQFLWSAPLLGVAWVVALGERDGSRRGRLARWASVPLLVGATVGAAAGLVMPAGAVAVLWWGAAVAVANAEGPAARLGEAGAWLGLALVAAVVGHVERPLLPLERDPAVALHHGEPLADDAVRWAMPPGVPRHDPRAREATLVLTERPEDAALLRFLTGIPAVAWDGCGGTGPLVGHPTSDVAVFVRPRGSGPPCVGDGWSVTRSHASEAYGPAGRSVGSWEWFELAAP